MILVCKTVSLLTDLFVCTEHFWSSVEAGKWAAVTSLRLGLETKPE
jgi:hypothetical protein